MGNKWSIQWTQSAAKNGASYIVVSGDRLEAKGVARSESYTVNIIRKGDETSIGNISSDSKGIEINDGNVICDKETTSVALYTPDGKLLKAQSGNILPVKGLEKGLYIVVADSCADRAVKTYKITVR